MRIVAILVATVALAVNAARADAPAAAAAEKDAWAVSLQLPSKARPGEGARAAVRIRGKGGYHVNGDYPTSFTPDPAAAGTLGAKKIALTERLSSVPCPKEAGQACDVSFALPISGPGAGEAVVAGTLAFSVCTAERCLIEKVKLSAQLPRS